MTNDMYLFLRVLCEYLYLNMPELDLTMPTAMRQAFPDNSFEENSLLLQRLLARVPNAWDSIMMPIEDVGLRRVLEELRVFREPDWSLLPPGPFDQVKKTEFSRREEFRR